MIAGHPDIIKNLVERYANGTLPNAMMFCGDAHLGKRTVAYAFAYFIERGVWPKKNKDGTKTTLIDAFFLEKKDGTIGIDEIRELQYFLRQRPFMSPCRVAIVDNAESLTHEAQHALLKVCEEPPSYAVVILVVRDQGILLPTLVSRLQRYYFSSVSKKEIMPWVMKEFGIAEKKAESLAVQSFGKPGVVHAMLHDDAFQRRLNMAEDFLNTPHISRRAFLKTLLENPEFDLRNFLDDLIFVLSKPPFRALLWHTVVELRGVIEMSPLNSRIQLSYLWTTL